MQTLSDTNTDTDISPIPNLHIYHSFLERETELLPDGKCKQK